MKQLAFWITVVCITIISFVLLSMVVFAQEPQAPVELEALVDFGEVFDGVSELMRNVLKEGLVLFLSIFFVWFSFMCFKAFIEGRMQRYDAVMKRVGKEVDLQNKREVAQDARVQAKIDRKWRAREASWAVYDTLAFRDVLRSRQVVNAEATREYAQATLQWSDATKEMFCSTDYAKDYAEISRWDNLRSEGSWDSQTDDAYFEKLYQRDSILDEYKELGRDQKSFDRYYDEYDAISVHRYRFTNDQLRIFEDVESKIYNRRKELDERFDDISRRYEDLTGEEFHHSLEVDQAWRDGYGGRNRDGY